MSAATPKVRVLIDGAPEYLDREQLVQRLRDYDRVIAASELDTARSLAMGGLLLEAAANTRGYGSWQHVRNDAGVHHNRCRKMRDYARKFVDHDTGRFDEQAWRNAAARALENHEVGIYPTRISAEGMPSQSAIEVAAEIRPMPKRAAGRTEHTPSSAHLRTTANPFASTADHDAPRRRDPFAAAMDDCARVAAPTPVSPPARIARHAGASGTQAVLDFHLAESGRQLAGRLERAQRLAESGDLDAERARDLQARIDDINAELEELTR